MNIDIDGFVVKFIELEQYLNELVKDKKSFIHTDLITELNNIQKSRINMFDTVEIINDDDFQDSFVYFEDIQTLINKYS